MRNIFVILFALLLITSCDDGDIITAQLDFELGLDRCDNNTTSYLLYATKDDPSESLTILIPRNANNELLFTQATEEPTELITNSNTTRFNYRTYNRNIIGTELCNVVQSGDLNIIEDFEAQDGAVIVVNSTIIDDDNDGIPTAMEGADPNSDGDFSDSLDSDGDGIFDYLDEDDDNDNVLTSIEASLGDTDGDGIDNYLDIDDDGDTIDTILEDENGDMNPANDTSDNNGNLVALYLNDIEVTPFPNPGLRDDNQFERTVTTSFSVSNFNIEILRQDFIDLGMFVNSFMTSGN